MIINWFIVLAQIINFLVLVALLRWVLYRPVLRVIRDRREQVAGEFEEAHQLQREARREIEKHRRLQDDLRSDREQRIEDTEAEVEEQRRLRMAELRQEVEAERARWREELDDEQHSFFDGLRAGIIEQVQRIARRALNDLATVELEEQVIGCFLDHLGRLDPAERKRINGALERQGRSGEAVVTVRTSFPLSDALRGRIRQTLQELFPAMGRLDCRRQEDLSCGIVASLADQRIGWSLDSYLSDLEAEFRQHALPEDRHHADVPAQV